MWRAADGETKWSRLSIRKIAQLQTFPEDYKWPAAIPLSRQLIGNAMPDAAPSLRKSFC